MKTKTPKSGKVSSPSVRITVELTPWEIGRFEDALEHHSRQLRIYGDSPSGIYFKTAKMCSKILLAVTSQSKAKK